MRVHSIKGTVLLRETKNSNIYVPFTLTLRITFHNLRSEANYTSAPELTQRYSWGILKMLIMWKLRFLCKNWKTLT